MGAEVKIDWDATIDELNKGWGKEGYGIAFTPDGMPLARGEGVCLLGAVCWANQMCIGDVAVMSESVLQPIVREQFPERATYGDGYVPFFNDHTDTTLEDVILVCEKARANQ